MKIFALSCFALSVLAVTPSFAGTLPKAKAQNWQLEPDSFMGIRFDQKVEDVLPLCPPSTQPRSRMCHEAPYSNLYTVAMGPDIGFGYNLSVFAGGDGIESFYLTTDSDNYLSLAQLLINKYGQPTERSSELVKTKGGAEFNNETLVWKGAKVLIFSQKYSGDINTSVVSIKSVAASEKKAAEAERKAKESADKL